MLYPSSTTQNVNVPSRIVQLCRWTPTLQWCYILAIARAQTRHACRTEIWDLLGRNILVCQLIRNRCSRKHSCAAHACHSPLARRDVYEITGSLRCLPVSTGGLTKISTTVVATTPFRFLSFCSLLVNSRSVPSTTRESSGLRSSTARTSPSPDASMSSLVVPWGCLNSWTICKKRSRMLAVGVHHHVCTAVGG